MSWISRNKKIKCLIDLNNLLHNGGHCYRIIEFKKGCLAKIILCKLIFTYFRESKSRSNPTTSFYYFPKKELIFKSVDIFALNIESSANLNTVKNAVYFELFDLLQRLWRHRRWRLQIRPDWRGRRVRWQWGAVWWPWPRGSAASRMTASRLRSPGRIRILPPECSMKMSLCEFA